MTQKIFLIGFNKCGTSSFHFMFKKSGLRSAHFGGPDQDTNLALQIHRNFMLARPILSGIDHYDAYGDISYSDHVVYIEGSRLYGSLYREYPDSYFILNTRNLERWLRSRIAHGSLLRRAASVYRCAEAEVLHLWRDQFVAHETEVVRFFSKRPSSRFLRFDIETGNIAEVGAFLKPDFALRTQYWQKKKETTAASKEKVSAMLRRV